MQPNGPALTPAKSAGRKQRAAALISFVMRPTKQVHYTNLQLNTKPMLAMLNVLSWQPST